MCAQTNGRKQKCRAKEPFTAVLITPQGYIVNRIYCEIDSDGISVYRDELDPDDMTDYGYRHRNQPRRTWSPPGYGDDD